MNILVTGASGFIGSHLVNRLKRDNEVVALIRDFIPSRWLSEALDGCIIVRGDVRDYNFIKRVLVGYDIQQVYHLSAVAIVKNAVKHPIETFDVNVLGTVKLLKASSEAGVEKFLILSTDKIFGEGLDKRELDPYNPVEVYGCSKACQDLIGRTWNNVYEKPEVIVARSCNVYGYDPFNSRIIPNTIKKCIKGESPIIYKNYVGKRQYIYVEDLVSALIFLMNFRIAYMEGVFNIATNDIYTQEEVVKKILEFFPDIKPKYVERPKYREIREQSMRPSEFGWKPKYSFEEGIRLTIEKFKKYRGDWR